MAQGKTVREYIEALEKNKSEKPAQVREGLETFVELWRKAVTNGVVAMEDDIEAALVKIEGKGGLYPAAEE